MTGLRKHNATARVPPVGVLRHVVIVDTLLIDAGGGGKAENREILVDKRDNAGIQAKLFT